MIRTAAALALLAVPAHAGGYVSPVPFGPPIMPVEALFPGPSIATPPPELLIAGVGLALLLLLLSRDDGDHAFVAPPPPEPAPVPVPPAAPLMLAGMVALFARRWL